MNEKPEILKVHPEFHKMIKIRASERGISILEYTKNLASVGDSLEGSFRDKKECKERKDGFRFRSF